MIVLNDTSVEAYLNNTRITTSEKRWLKEKHAQYLTSFIQFASDIISHGQYAFSYHITHSNHAKNEIVQVGKNNLCIIWDVHFWNMLERFVYYEDFLSMYGLTKQNEEKIKKYSISAFLFFLSLKFYEYPRLSNALIDIAHRHGLTEMMMPLQGIVSEEEDFHFFCSKFFAFQRDCLRAKFVRQPKEIARYRKRYFTNLLSSYPAEDSDDGSISEVRMHFDIPTYDPLKRSLENVDISVFPPNLEADVFSLSKLGQSLQEHAPDNTYIVDQLCRALVLVFEFEHIISEISGVWESVARDAGYPNTGHYESVKTCDSQALLRDCGAYQIMYAYAISGICKMDEDIVLGKIQKIIQTLKPFYDAYEYAIRPVFAERLIRDSNIDSDKDPGAASAMAAIRADRDSKLPEGFRYPPG